MKRPLAIVAVFERLVNVLWNGTDQVIDLRIDRDQAEALVELMIEAMARHASGIDRRAWAS